MLFDEFHFAGPVCVMILKETGSVFIFFAGGFSIQIRRVSENLLFNHGFMSFYWCCFFTKPSQVFWISTDERGVERLVVSHQTELTG